MSSHSAALWRVEGRNDLLRQFATNWVPCLGPQTRKDAFGNPYACVSMSWRWNHACLRERRYGTRPPPVISSGARAESRNLAPNGRHAGFVAGFLHAAFGLGRNAKGEPSALRLPWQGRVSTRPYYRWQAADDYRVCRRTVAMPNALTGTVTLCSVQVSSCWFCSTGLVCQAFAIDRDGTVMVASVC